MTEEETNEWGTKYNEWAKNCLEDFADKFGEDTSKMLFIGALETFKTSLLKSLVNTLRSV